MKREFTTNAKAVALQRQNERNDPYRGLSPDQLRKAAQRMKPPGDVASKAIPREYVCGTCGKPLDQNRQCRSSTPDWPHR